jgi:hypothetical protein
VVLGEAPDGARGRAGVPLGQVDAGRDGDRERHLGVPVVTIDEQDRNRDQTDQDGADPGDAAEFHDRDCGAPVRQQRRRSVRNGQVWFGLLAAILGSELRKLRE